MNVIEQAAKTMHDAGCGCGEYRLGDPHAEGYRKQAEALAAAGLLVTTGDDERAQTWGMVKTDPGRRPASTNYYLHTPVPWHIGKSTAGWVFLWRGYQAQQSPAGTDLDGPATWWTYLQSACADGAVIKDNSGAGEMYTLDEFKNMVVGMRTMQRRKPPFVQTGQADDVMYGDFD